MGSVSPEHNVGSAPRIGVYNKSAFKQGQGSKVLKFLKHKKRIFFFFNGPYHLQYGYYLYELFVYQPNDTFANSDYFWPVKTCSVGLRFWIPLKTIWKTLNMSLNWNVTSFKWSCSCWQSAQTKNHLTSFSQTHALRQLWPWSLSLNCTDSNKSPVSRMWLHVVLRFK